MRNRFPSRGILAASIATLLTGATFSHAADGVFSSAAIGAGDQDANVGLLGTKTYFNAVNLNGGALTINGVSFEASAGANSTGTGYTISGVPNTFGPFGGVNNVGGQLGSLLNDFIYGGNPGAFTLTGLTVGQTYSLTYYNRAWDVPARTQTITTTSGAATSFNQDFNTQRDLNLLRYTFTASGTSETLNFAPANPGYTMHFYGFSTEQVFNNSWTGGANWTSATWSVGVPNSAGANADFAAQGAPTSINLDASQTVGHVRFDGANAWTISGASTLTLQADAGAVSVLGATSGTHTISTPVTLNSDVLKTGAGNVVLSGALADNGKNVTLGAGTLEIANAAAQTLRGNISGGGNLAKSNAGTLTLTGNNTYTGTTVVNGGTLKLQAGSAPILTDNFTATGNPNTSDLNFNLANRQTGSAALQSWTGSGNAQVGNATSVQQPFGTNGDYLLLAFGGQAKLAGLPLSSGNVPGPIKINFDMFKGSASEPSDWTSFTLRTNGDGFPIGGSGEFGFLYRNNTGIQMFNNGGLLQDFGSTSGGDSFAFYLADSAGTGSPFAGNGTRVIVTQGGGILGSYALNTGMAASLIAFGSNGTMIGGVDNLGVNNFKTNVLDPATAVSLTASGATLELDAVHQTVASLSGVSGSVVNLGPFSRLTVNGAASTTFDGVIAGTFGALTKDGSGTLTLTGNNTYTGGTTVSGGIIKAGSANALGASGSVVSVAAGGSLDFNGQQLDSYTQNIRIAGTGADPSLGALGNSGGSNLNAIRGITLTGDASIGGTGGRWDIGRLDFNADPNNTVNHIDGGGFVLTKVGSSALGLLTGATNLAGFVLNGGAIIPHENTSFGAGPVTINAGVLNTWGGLTVANNFTLNGGTIGTDAGFNDTYTGSFAINSAVTFNPASGDITLSGPLSGSGAISKTGGGVLLLSGNNAQTGTLAVDGGHVVFASGTGNATNGNVELRNPGSFLIMNAPNQFGPNAGLLFNSSGAHNEFALYGNNQTIASLASNNQFAVVQNSHGGFGPASASATLTINQNINTAYSGVFRDNTGNDAFTLAVVKSGSGTLELNSIADYTGGTTVNGGILQINSNGGDSAIKNTLTINSGGTVKTVGDGTGFGFNGNHKITTLNINGGLATSDGTMHVWDIGGGVNMTGGTLQSNGGVSDPNGSQLEWRNSNVTTNASASTATIAGRIRMRADGGGTGITFNVADGAAASDLLVSAAITEASGAQGITKSGAGTMTLTGNNTFTGSTTINGGTLQAAAAGALSATSGVTVNTGGTLLLSGSGDRVGDGVPLTLNGGTFDTGGLSETLGTLTLSADSIIDFGNGVSTLTFADSSAINWNGFRLSIYNWSGNTFDGGGIDQLRFAGNGLTATQLAQIDFYSGTTLATKISITPHFSTNGFVSFGEVVPVPEPSAVATVLTIFGLVLHRETRRGRRSSAVGRGLSD